MKHLYYATAFIMAAASAKAGDLSVRGLDDPTVITPAPVSTFGGFYAGLSYGSTNSTTDIDDIYERECQFGDSHTSRKCAFGGHEANPEIAALERGNAPWRDFQGGVPVVYDDTQFIMYGEADSTFTYTTLNADDATPVKGKDAQNVLVDTITELTGDSEGAGVFVGYRMQSGAFVGGVEIGTDGSMTTAEAQAGLAVANVLGYGFAGLGRYDGTDGNVYGAGVDLRVTDRLTIGGKYTLGEWGETETETLQARVSISF